MFCFTVLAYYVIYSPVNCALWSSCRGRMAITEYVIFKAFSSNHICLVVVSYRSPTGIWQRLGNWPHHRQQLQECLWWWCPGIQTFSADRAQRKTHQLQPGLFKVFCSFWSSFLCILYFVTFCMNGSRGATPHYKVSVCSYFNGFPEPRNLKLSLELQSASEKPINSAFEPFISFCVREVC